MRRFISFSYFLRAQVENTKREIEILASLDHPFLMRAHYSFQSKSKLYMVLDYKVRGTRTLTH